MKMLSLLTSLILTSQLQAQELLTPAIVVDDDILSELNELEAQPDSNFIPGEDGLLAAKSGKTKASSGKSKVKKPQDAELVEALVLARKGDYKNASTRLFGLSLNPRYREKRNQIRYLLGLMLYRMKLNQVATFQFISVAKDGDNEYLNKSLENLSLAADYLGDDTVLNYAISKVKVEQFPKDHRDMLFFRIGEYQMRNEAFDQAAESFARVSEESPYYVKAKYNQALSFAEMNQVDRAIASYDSLIESRASKPVTDSAKVAAQLGKARTLYQGKRWDDAIAAYREVPRDTIFWHDTLLESAWAMLRSGKFRSAISNFQSLHSAYYEDTYLPESLMLRAITYFYICKYEEMEKVIQLFEKIYRPVYDETKRFLDADKAPGVFYKETAKIMREYILKGKVENPRKYGIPLVVARKVYQEGDFQKTFKYLQKLLEENRIIKSQTSDWQRSPMGKYAKKVIVNRINKARNKAGRIVQEHLGAIQEELFDLFEQQAFVKFEMVRAKKEALKSKIAGAELGDVQIEEDTSRDYYIQNGYEYWPFRGEYWLDEIGNYHYLGTQSCQ